MEQKTKPPEYASTMDVRQMFDRPIRYLAKLLPLTCSQDQSHLAEALKLAIEAKEQIGKTSHATCDWEPEDK